MWCLPTTIKSTVELPISFSDHCVINFVLIVETSPCVSNSYADTVKQFSWYHADFVERRDSIQIINWAEVICYNPHAGSAWSTIVPLIWEAVDRCVPSFTHRVTGRKTKYRHSYKLWKLAAKKGESGKYTVKIHPTEECQNIIEIVFASTV